MRNLDTRPVALLADLVDIDSVNPALVAGAAGEARIVDYLRSRLKHSGFATTVVPARRHPDRPSLVAVPPGPPDWPMVVLNGHLDTVGVAGMPEPFTPRVDGDRLYGRGAADMKGGVAALVAAAEQLVADGAPVRPVLALVADEENASLGSEAVIAALPHLGVRPDVCLIAEPTDLVLSRSLRVSAW
jgi:acetylornithine deacetylase